MKPERQSLYFNEPVDLVTPYQRARQHWDDRIGSARVQAGNWRLMAFGLFGLSSILLGVVIWQVSRGSVIPYVVEVGEKGEVRAVGPAARNYVPGDRQIAFHLAAFVSQIRSLPADPVVVRQNWLKAYHYVTGAAVNTLSEHARTRDPFADVGRTMISVEVSNVVRASKNSFQIRWEETAFVGGTQDSRSRYTGLFTIRLRPPGSETGLSEEGLRNNPLGIYIEAMNWSKDALPETPAERGGK